LLNGTGDPILKADAEAYFKISTNPSSQLSLKPRYSAQCFQVLRSHRKDLRRGQLKATTGKEEVQDNLLARCPVFAFADTQILREGNRPFS